MYHRPTSPFSSSSVVKASSILVRYQIFMNAKCHPGVNLNDSFSLSLPRFICLFLLACMCAPTCLQTSCSCFSQARLSSLVLSHTYMWWYVGLHLWDAAAARTSVSWLWWSLWSRLVLTELSVVSRSQWEVIVAFLLFRRLIWFPSSVFFFLRPFNVTAFENQGCPLADVINRIELLTGVSSEKKSHLILPAWWFTLT